MTLKELTTSIKGAIALAVALYGGLAPVLQLLVLFAAIDVASGLLAAFATRSLASDISFRGVAKKGLMFLIVGMAYQLSDVLGLAAGGFYCAHEGLSILENAGRAGVPIPAGLREALAKLNPQPAPAVDPTIATTATLAAAQLAATAVETAAALVASASAPAAPVPQAVTTTTTTKVETTV